LLILYFYHNPLLYIWNLFFFIIIVIIYRFTWYSIVYEISFSQKFFIFCFVWFINQLYSNSISLLLVLFFIRTLIIVVNIFCLNFYLFFSVIYLYNFFCIAEIGALFSFNSFLSMSKNRNVSFNDNVHSKHPNNIFTNVYF
jgi:hypothetical protein